ncbi:MAG TPA: type II toxin-antitoxin system RelE/ParE family toxin [Mesorhizobium sp.]|jgi:mRNA interferase RelE/StbE|nr:type II toxin-antitoxin system RelE/ParE family toxin [Mesorhizobium sp.]
MWCAALAWRIELSETAERKLRRLDPQVFRRLLSFLRTRIAALDDPRSIGEALSGKLRGYGKYRVGDCRLICNIIDDRLVVVVVRIGQRSDVCQ